MKKASFVIAAVLASCFVSSPAQAQGHYVPMDVLVGKADRIIVGEVTAIGKPQEMDLAAPDFPASGKGWYHTFKVKVARQVLPAANEDKSETQPSGEKAPKDKVLDVITRCADPDPKAAAPAVKQTYHNPLVGDSCLMILSKLPGQANGEYYLPNRWENLRATNDPGVKAIEKLAPAAIESWSWGKPVNGLQIGLYVFASFDTPPRRFDQYMEASVALRNTTDKPLAVNLYEMDKCLEITATSAGGNVFHSEFYNWKKHPVTRFDAAADTFVIEPKGKIFIGPAGLAYTTVAMALGDGKYVFQASYTSKRQANSKDHPKLWTGTITSKPLTGGPRKAL
jgi:hypothetical protein